MVAALVLFVLSPKLPLYDFGSWVAEDKEFAKISTVPPANSPFSATFPIKKVTYLDMSHSLVQYLAGLYLTFSFMLI